MSEITSSAVSPGSVAQPEPWHPGGAIIGVLTASIALFLATSGLILIGAVVLTSIVDVGH